MNPSAMAGITNISPYMSTIEVIPSLLRPTILIIPISRVLVSTLIISREYINSTAIITKSKMMMSKISPMNSTACE